MDKEERDLFEERYQLVAAREKSPKTPFYYGVKSTGIFCLPGCSSRLPKRENTLFFETPGEALARGFRPCKRCRPLEESQGQAPLISRLCRYMEEAEEAPTLRDLAKRSGYSEGYIQRLFKKMTGVSPKEYSQAVKSARFKKAAGEAESVSTALYAAGYGSSSRLYEKADTRLAMTPGQSLKKGKGLTLRRGVFPCSLGFVLIALSPKGVAAVEMGDEKSALLSHFSERYKNALLEELKEEDREEVSLILNKVEDSALPVSIPLDIQGTIFQCKVWKALQAIPAGETRSYSDIAQEIGSPQSVRAVANACGQNRLALLVPCHRVVGKNGKLGGYRWGVERKISLLEKEEKIKP
ncbi:MAG: methylated-DNA--[protein]-cysteine S-methyltransferase [Spirochaetales bacterium]|nr:methylated-DNA--[protein]-cysteine S-methyltransferase [Spirochaetales bacterium]